MSLHTEYIMYPEALGTLCFEYPFFFTDCIEQYVPVQVENAIGPLHESLRPYGSMESNRALGRHI